MEFRGRRSSVLLFSLLTIPARQPNVEIRGFNFVEAKQNKKSMEIRAAAADVYKPEDLMVLKEPLTLLWSKERAPYRVNGAVGVLKTATRDLEVRGGSQLLSPDELLFVTEKLRYDPAANDFLSDESVEVRRLRMNSDAAFKLAGQGLRIDLDRSLYEIHSKVRASQRVSSASNFLVTSRRAEITPELRQAYFYGSVDVRSKYLSLRGDELTIHFKDNKPSKLVMVGRGRNPKIQATMGKLKLISQGLDVTLGPSGEMERSEAKGSVDAIFDDGTKFVAERLVSVKENGQSVFILEGQVNIFTGERTATSEFARFYPDTGDIHLERVAAVKKGDQLIEGERIRFSTKNSEVRVEKAKGRVGRQDLGLGGR